MEMGGPVPLQDLWVPSAQADASALFPFGLFEAKRKEGGREEKQAGRVASEGRPAGGVAPTNRHSIGPAATGPGICSHMETVSLSF